MATFTSARGMQLLMLQEQPELQPVQWTARDEAYPAVISHRLFPMAVLTMNDKIIGMIADEVKARYEIVLQIVQEEANK